MLHPHDALCQSIRRKPQLRLLPARIKLAVVAPQHSGVIQAARLLLPYPLREGALVASGQCR
jgi:hypothetical protein